MRPKVKKIGHYWFVSFLGLRAGPFLWESAVAFAIDWCEEYAKYMEQQYSQMFAKGMKP